ncbi:PAAR domain-containing protein, partial [Pseudomonas protegens]|nr:PAAR domain-containing protein [Pseudomonas protegens]
MDIIRLGDSTSHGGTVVEAFSQNDLNGKPMAGVGHKVVCPLCKGVFPISEGSALL